MLVFWSGLVAFIGVFVYLFVQVKLRMRKEGLSFQQELRDITSEVDVASKVKSAIATSFVMTSVYIGWDHIVEILSQYTGSYLFRALGFFAFIQALRIAWRIFDDAKDYITTDPQNATWREAFQLSAKAFILKWNPVYDGFRSLMLVLAAGVFLNVYESAMMPLGEEVATAPLIYKYLILSATSGGLGPLGDFFIVAFPRVAALYALYHMFKGIARVIKEVYIIPARTKRLIEEGKLP